MVKTVGDVVTNLMSKVFETYGVNCPVCGKPLLRPQILNKRTGQKMAGACPSCGYMEDINHREIPDNKALTASAHKNEALGYINTYSIFSSFDVFNCRFSNYTVSSDASKQVLERSRTIANRIINGETIHTLMIGATGRGKTHLAVGMMYWILERSGYKLLKTVMKNGKPVETFFSWKIIFIDWRELIERKKQSFNDDQMAKQINKTMAEIKNADVVILDDFGSERGTEYSLDLADAFWRDRENKTVIVTTNLIGSDLTARYGDRTLSRMKNHGVNNGITFANIPDHRGLVE